MDGPPPTIADVGDPKGEFPFEPSAYLFHLLVGISRYRDAEIEELLRPIGISLAKYRALTVVMRFQPCTMGEAADFSIVERTTMTRIIDQLVEAGLVLRISRGADRRQVILNLSDAGQVMAAKATAAILDQNVIDLEGISERDLRTLVRLSQSLLANLAPDPVARERLLTFRRPGKAVP